MAGRVLGNYGSFSEETRRKVTRAARLVQYTPNTIARSLRTRLTRTVGVLISGYYQLLLVHAGARTPGSGCQGRLQRDPLQQR